MSDRIEKMPLEPQDPGEIIVCLYREWIEGSLSKEQMWQGIRRPELALKATEKTLEHFVFLFDRLEDLENPQTVLVTASDVSEIADHFQAYDRADLALALYSRILPMFERYFQWGDVARCRLNQGNVLQLLNRYEEALAEYAEAKPIFERHQKWIDVASCHMNRANALSALDLYQEALAEYTEAEPIFERHEEWVAVARCRMNRAVVLRALDRYDDALTGYAEAEQIFKRHQQWLDMARCQMNLAVVLNMLGRYEEALTSYAEAETIFRRQKQWVNLARCQMNRALVLNTMGRNEEALAGYAEAEPIFKLHQQWKSLARCQMYRAVVLWALDRYDDALTGYAEAEQIFKLHKWWVDLAVCRVNRSVVLRALGRYEEALGGYAEAEPIFERHHQWVDVARCRMNRAVISDTLGRYEEALAGYAEAEPIFERHHQWVDVARCHVNRAVVLDKLGRYEEALASYPKTEAILERHQQWVMMATCRVNRANVLRALDKYEEALAGYAEAQPIFERHQQWVGVARCRMDRAIVLNTLGRHAEALYEFSLVDFKRFSPLDQMTLHSGLADCYRATGQLAKASIEIRKICATFRHARRLGGIDEHRLDVLYNWCYWLVRPVNFALSLEQKDVALEAIQDAKAGLMGDLRLRDYLPRPPSSENLTGLRNRLVERLRGNAKTLPAETRLVCLDPERTVVAGNYLEAFRAECPPLPQQYREEMLPLSRMQAALSRGWAILDFWVQDEHQIKVFIITRDRIYLESIANPHDDSCFFKQIELWNILTHVGPLSPDLRPDAMRDTDLRNFLSEGIYARFFRPLEKHLEGIHGLYLVPHDYLHHLPLHAARTKVGRDWVHLADRFEVAYLPSSAFLPQLSPVLTSGRVLSLANPELGTPLTLPFAHWEGQEFRRRLGEQAGRFHLGSEVGYERTSAWEDAALVHFSGHGTTISGFLHVSHLRLCDDLLLAHDVLYRTAPLVDGALVVLNGCETGVRDLRAVNEGLGLMSAFLLRGASLVLSTLWPVADACAAEMAVTFLHELWHNQARPAQALRAAQQAARRLHVDEIARRRRELLNQFSADRHPHEASKLLPAEIEYLLSRGQFDQAQELAGTCLPLLKKLKEEEKYHVIERHTRDRVRVAVVEYPFDHPLFWSGYQLIGRVH